ncbi:MAG: hypothetical protein QXK08_03420 [Candidatus Woesearchaeota archaeon]
MKEMFFKNVPALHYVYNRVRGFYRSQGLTHEGLRLCSHSILVNEAFERTHIPKLVKAAKKIGAEYIIK